MQKSPYINREPMGFCYNLTPLFVGLFVFVRLIVLPPYEERFTRYLAYITADKVRNRKIKNHIELLSTFLDQSREPANCKILKINCISDLIRFL